MKCLKILRRHWICSIFVFSFFSLLSLFGLSHDSLAYEQPVCSFSISNASPRFTIPSSCRKSSDIPNNSVYTKITIELVTPPSTYVSIQPFLYTFGAGSTPSFTFSSSSSSGFSLTVYTFPSDFYSNSNFAISGSSTYSINVSIIYSDSSFISEPEPCPVCPVIPENPYDNKFDAITKAIYTCGAVLIMLYFFFCIYKIIVKDGGSR